MSLEAPEIYILSQQMTKELLGKKVKTCELRDYEKSQRIGFINKNIHDFDRIIGRIIIDIISRGNIIVIKFNNKMNLLIGPEYGGKYYVVSENDKILDKWHMLIEFEDKTRLVGRLSGMGALLALNDEELNKSYLFKRDFSTKMSPLEENFTDKKFIAQIKTKNRQLKSVLVGKDAELVGISNSAFQDILYRAKLNPKRKASELSNSEQLLLFNAIKDLISERLDHNGKGQFRDLYQNAGTYIAKMGPNCKGGICTYCKNKIEEINLGGGKIFFCPKCQN